MREPRYRGSKCSGICVCGCAWEDHHLGIVMNPDYIKETGECYIPQECDRYGCNEVGGMKYNKKTSRWEEHCQGYKDSKQEETK